MAVADQHITKPTIYPSYCFDAAPTYKKSALIRAIDLSALKLYMNVPGETAPPALSTPVSIAR
jgi:hypothetical protein